MGMIWNQMRAMGWVRKGWVWHGDMEWNGDLVKCQRNLRNLVTIHALRILSAPKA